MVIKKSSKWFSYNDLAWTETILTSPAEHRKEVEPLCRAIVGHSKSKTKNLLHLGCEAGNYDIIFKKHINVTGVDISRGMLRVARRLNKDVKYIQGDMRNVMLDAKYDIAVIPDSIGYMTTVKDLKKQYKQRIII